MKNKKIMNSSKIAVITISVIFIFFLALYIHLGPYYELFNVVKTITIIQYSGFLLFALVLYNLRHLFIKLKKEILNLLIIFGFSLIMICLFEMLWSFNYWFSNYTLNVLSGDPKNSRTLDMSVYEPSPELMEIYLYETMPLNTSAKTNTLLFIMSVYFVYFLIDVSYNKSSDIRRSNK